MNIPTSSRLALAAAASAVVLSACVVAPARPVRYAPAEEFVVTDVAPPAPYVETLPPPPYAGAVWINGYWGWRANRHVWVGGRYEAPRAGYAWHPHRWVQRDGRWHLEGGVWLRG